MKKESQKKNGQVKWYGQKKWEKENYGIQMLSNQAWAGFQVYTLYFIYKMQQARCCCSFFIYYYYI